MAEGSSQCGCSQCSWRRLQAGMAINETGWSPSVWATLVALIGVPAAMVVGELCVRYDRRKIVMAIALISTAFAAAIGLTTG